MDMMPGLLRLYVREAIEVLGDPTDAEIGRYVEKRIDVGLDALMLAVLLRGSD